MSVKPLTEQHLEFLSLKGGCIGLSESRHVKMPHCWKSHVTAQLLSLWSEYGICIVQNIVFEPADTNASTKDLIPFSSNPRPDT